MKMYPPLVLLLLGLFDVSQGEGGDRDKNAFIVSKTEPEVDRKEFEILCEAGFMIRERPSEVDDSKECAVTEPGEFKTTEDLQMLFTLIFMCSWGAFVRFLAKKFQVKTPYTVLLLISGAFFGAFSHVESFCDTMHKYTAIARISPQHILYTFLPLLIFESAFSISVHTFMRSFSQIFLLAFPGMIISAFSAAIVCHQFFSEYGWSFLDACLFGCIVSATDPVAVVAILRDLGVSEQLGVVIDGESLMNDGVAILMFEIFHHYKLNSDLLKDPEYFGIALHVVLKFCQIALGGPNWGYITGRMTIFALGYVYNDPAVEISATICAAYLTYWSSEYVLHVSGVIAVVVLGITLGAERTVISPESEEPVHHFWEMIGYLANTVLFFLVGIVISETAITHFDFIDIPYLILLYIALHVIRFLMLLMFYPILKRIGYGMEWQSLIVIMWGGLRGAVGICLALQIYEDDHLCNEIYFGPKVLFHTAGIVALTLIVNGTTTKGLLQILKLTDVTVGQKEEMNNAVRRLRRLKWWLIQSYKMEKELMDTHWYKVDEICKVTNPYASHEDDPEKLITSLTLQPPRPIKDNTTVCWHCSNIVENEPTVSEYRDMTNDARLRAIKSMKLHYLHMYEKGVLTEQATQFLLIDAEKAEDNYLRIIQASNFHKNMKAHGFYLWLRDKVIVRFKLHKEEMLPDPPDEKWRFIFYRIVNREWFEGLTIIVVLLNMIVVIWDVLLIFHSEDSKDQCKWNISEQKIKYLFLYANYAFCVFYTAEIVVRILGTKFKHYVRSVWNYIFILVLIVAYVDIYIAGVALDPVRCREYKIITGSFKEYLNLGIRGLRLVQITRSIRLLRPLIPQLLRRIRRELNKQVFIGFDMGKGFIETSDAVIKFIPQIAENKKVQQVLKDAMKKERNACAKDMVLINAKFPGVAVALKTRNACRSALNQMQFALTEIRDGGFLDDPDCLLLKRILEDKKRRLTHSPPYVQPAKHVPPSLGFHAGEDGDKKSEGSQHSVTIVEENKLPPV